MFPCFFSISYFFFLGTATAPSGVTTSFYWIPTFGATGTSGYSGYSGYSGFSGVSGTSGYSGVESTLKKSVSLPHQTWTTAHTFTADAGKIRMYLVGAGLAQDDVVNYSSYAIISVANTSVKVLVYETANATYFQLQMSGLNLQLWQGSGATQIGYASILRFMDQP